MLEGEAVALLRISFSLILLTAALTPIKLYHAYVARALQVEGSLCFPIPVAAPNREWIAEDP